MLSNLFLGFSFSGDLELLSGQTEVAKSIEKTILTYNFDQYVFWEKYMKQFYFKELSSNNS